MKRYSGTSVCRGIVTGQAVIHQKTGEAVFRRYIKDTKEEIVRLDRAISQSKAQLKELYERAKAETGESGAAIFSAYQMILEDREYYRAIVSKICGEHVNAGFSVLAVGEQFAGIFAAMDDEYMRARAADIKAVSDRLIRNLSGRADDTCKITKPSIVVAGELAPGELVRMDRKKLLALVLVHGLSTSHTAILARMMNIPTLICPKLALKELSPGMDMIVDAAKGELIVEPDADAYEDARRRIEQEQQKTASLRMQKGKESVTAGGKKIRICANIGSIHELDDVIEQDAEGIGLFRSECLYLEREVPPTEEEQLEIYRNVLLRMDGKPVVIRTMDMGSDKQVPYLRIGKEANPALGCRAIRVCLRQPEIFKTQLRALFRAAAYGNLSIMYPMISASEEMEAIREIVKDVEDELKQQQTPYCIPKQGVMIETPAAVMISEELAQLADFFSIGTNDLTQYTLAVDRQNEHLEGMYHPHHPAVLRMIEMTVNNAHKYGKKTAICGELAADLELTETFVKLGVDELSAAPGMILQLRERIRGIN